MATGSQVQAAPSCMRASDSQLPTQLLRFLTVYIFFLIFSHLSFTSSFPLLSFSYLPFFKKNTIFFFFFFFRCLNHLILLFLLTLISFHCEIHLGFSTTQSMGNHASKRGAEPSSAINLDVKGLNSYEAACRADADVRSFDTSLHARANQVISSLAVGVEVKALSFESLKQVTECLLEMNQEVVRVILQCKKDIWKNQELFELVEEYFENSLQTLDFCTALEKCLKRARDSQLLILMALQHFEEEEAQVGRNQFAKTLQELRNFKASGDPFTEEFFKIFHSVYKQQTIMLEKLQHRKNKLDKKLKSIHAWRKLSSMIFVATFAAVLICSVVATVMAAPPVAAALSAASSIPLGSMGKWIDSLWKSYENALKGHKEVISSMQVGTYVAIKDMDNIRILIEKLEIEIEAMLQKADFAIKEEAVKFGVEEMKKKLAVFMKSVEDLGTQADMCSRDITRARTVVLQRIIKHPNN